MHEVALCCESHGSPYIRRKPYGSVEFSSALGMLEFTLLEFTVHEFVNSSRYGLVGFFCNLTSRQHLKNEPDQVYTLVVFGEENITLSSSGIAESSRAGRCDFRSLQLV